MEQLKTFNCATMKVSHKTTGRCAEILTQTRLHITLWVLLRKTKNQRFMVWSFKKEGCWSHFFHLKEQNNLITVPKLVHYQCFNTKNPHLFLTVKKYLKAIDSRQNSCVVQTSKHIFLEHAVNLMSSCNTLQLLIRNKLVSKICSALWEICQFVVFLWTFLSCGTIAS